MKPNYLSMASSSGSIATVAANVPFSEFAGLVEKINRTKGTDAKRSTLSDFISDWRKAHQRLHESDGNPDGDSTFPALRLLIPVCDKARLAYGIKEHTLAKLYTEILCLGKDSHDAQKLLNYKLPKHARSSAGDFAEVAFFILKDRCPSKGTLSIEDVNTCLTGIAEGNANKKKDEVKRYLLRLLKNTSALEQKWLIRIIMKDLKCGISQASVLQTFHPDAEHFFDVTQDLQRVCRELHDPKRRLVDIAVSLFSPFKPMLAARGDPEKIESQVENQEFIVEVKLDGERVQLHKDGDAFRYWSRSGNEWTVTYGSGPSSGNLTPYIVRCFKSDIRNCILDGEMMGFNHSTGTMGSKAEEFDIKRTVTFSSSGYEPCFIVFDVVMLNDQVLTGKPLKERKQILDGLFDPIEGRLMLSQWKLANSREACAKEFNDAIDNREEGIMVKRSDSKYIVASRKGGWFKLKPDYVLGVNDDVDLLILGGYFGTGNRSGMIAQFLCVVAVTEESTDRPKTFYSFCKVGTGYSKKDLYSYNQKLAQHWKVFDKNKPPAFLVLAHPLREKPDVYIEPENSIIVQVKAAEIQSSSSFKTGCTLRFPRVECFRDDKEWFECLTLSQLQELRSQNEGKLAKRHVVVSGDEGSGQEESSVSPVKKRRVVKTTAVKPTVEARYKAGVDAKQVTRLRNIFSGKEFCVMSSQNKANHEKIIIENSGSIVQNPGANTFCVLADKINLKVKNLMKLADYDIVHPDWLIRCSDVNEILDFQPMDLMRASQLTMEKLSERYDKYGDSYTEDVDEESLRSLFQRMDERKFELSPVSGISRAELYRECWPDESVHFGLLAGCLIYFCDEKVIGDSSTRMSNWESGGMRLLACEVVMHGARVSDSPRDENVTHVVMEPSLENEKRKNELQHLNKSRGKRFHLVTPGWIIDCIADDQWKNERPYYL